MVKFRNYIEISRRDQAAAGGARLNGGHSHVHWAIVPCVFLRWRHFIHFICDRQKNKKKQTTAHWKTGQGYWQLLTPMKGKSPWCQKLITASIFSSKDTFDEIKSNNKCNKQKRRIQPSKPCKLCTICVLCFSFCCRAACERFTVSFFILFITLCILLFSVQSLHAFLCNYLVWLEKQSSSSDPQH